MRICVYMCVYIYIYIHTPTCTTCIYIYIYIYIQTVVSACQGRHELLQALSLNYSIQGFHLDPDC